MHAAHGQIFRLLVAVLIFFLLFTFFPHLNSVQAAGGDVTPALAAGKEHTAVLLADGTVWTWGDNSYGQLGDGTLQGRTRPVQVKELDEVIAVAAGDYHTLALRSDGTVWAWGDNSYGQLGLVRDREEPGTFFRAKPEAVKYLTQATAITAGAYHSLALRADGTVQAWGNNSYGQIGDGTMENREAPRQVTFLNTAQAVCANGFSSAALMADGTIRTWGANWYGHLGDGRSGGTRTWPVRIQEFTNVKSIAMGKEHMVAVKADGTVWAWGNNNAGQLGDGTRINRLQPVQVLHVKDAIAVAAGEQHGMALTAGGTVWAWGDNSYSQIGDGTTLQRPIPVQLNELQGINFIAAGQDHSIALADNGTIWGWGSNWAGYLGDGSTEQRNRPVRVLLNVYGSPFRIENTLPPVTPTSPVLPLSPAPAMAPSLPPATVWVNDLPFTLEKHFMEAGRLMVPLRFLTTALDAGIGWDRYRGEALLIVDNTQTLRLTAGRKEVRFNKQSAILDPPPRLVEGRIFVPLRAMANLIGAEVRWQADSNSIHINYTGKKENM
ncbi:MAG: stalk domain-containing protein [Bacillota bacterium]